MYVDVGKNIGAVVDVQVISRTIELLVEKAAGELGEVWLLGVHGKCFEIARVLGF